MTITRTQWNDDGRVVSPLISPTTLLNAPLVTRCARCCGVYIYISPRQRWDARDRRTSVMTPLHAASVCTEIGSSSSGWFQFGQSARGSAGFRFYYECIVRIIYVLQMTCIYIEIDMNDTRCIALYTPILRSIWVIADRRSRAKL